MRIDLSFNNMDEAEDYLAGPDACNLITDFSNLLRELRNDESMDHSTVVRLVKTWESLLRENPSLQKFS